MFRSKALHVTNSVPTEKIAPNREKHPELISITPFLGTYYYRFNVTKPPFDDLRVRRAFSMSIDRQQIVDAVTKGGQIPVWLEVQPDTMTATMTAVPTRTDFQFPIQEQLIVELCSK